MEMEQSMSLLSKQGPVFPSISCNYSVRVPYEVQSSGLGGSALVPFPRALSVDRGSGVRAAWVSVQWHTWGTAFNVPGACGHGCRVSDRGR